ncbi:biotin-independent malonate decarboxylase subunit gamma, partial [Roseateles sp. GG27B]
RACLAALENLWGKYAVTAKQIEAERDAAAQTLQGYLVELGYVAMGGLRGLWRGDLADALRQALLTAPKADSRAADGAERGGRKLAAAVMQRVLDAA